MTSVGDLPEAAACPFEVRRPVMSQRWERLTFLHWRFDPALVQALVPPSLTVEVMDGAAWVGLVPFHMTVMAPGLPAVPWLSRFPETNVRTYVRDHEGRAGIWFLSLDAARLSAVIVARATYRLPYFWSRMRVTQNADVMHYDCTRRWPGHGPTSSVSVAIGSRYAPGELSELEHLLTARWVLFSRAGRRHRFARAWHPPWPLHRARAQHVRDDLIPAAGLPRPTGEPLVHYSPGVAVRIGAPQRYRMS